MEEQPRPLHIIKRDSETICLSSNSYNQNGPRKSSGNTDESQDSIRGTTGVDVPLTIPKKRKNMLSSRPGERFNTGASVAVTRRAVNMTDNFEGQDSDESDGYDGDRRAFATERAGADNPVSVRKRYLKDAREDPTFQAPRSLSEHVPFYCYNTPNAVTTPTGILKEARSANHLHQAETYGRGHALSPFDDESSAGTPSTRGYFSPYSDMFPLSLFERSATAIPFENRNQHHHSLQDQQYYQHHTQHSRQVHLPFVPPEPAPEPDSHILVPIISITPEHRSVSGSMSSFWVAIEVHAQVTRPLDSVSSREYAFHYDNRQSMPTLSAKDDAGFYRYGYISDMNIEVLPTAQSEIVEVIGKSPSLITLFPGSRRLLVAHIKLDTTKLVANVIANNYATQLQKRKADRLIEDLEQQLGAISQEYMQVQLSYAHSGFPKRDIRRDALGRDGGCVAVRTVIATTATAVIMQHNSSSLWSPPPSPSGSPLLAVVAKHWGPAAASDMAQRMAATSMVKMVRRPANPMVPWDAWDDGYSSTERPQTPDTPNMVVSEKQGELTPRATKTKQPKAMLKEVSPLSRAPTPASKIWKQIRHVSTAGVRSASRKSSRQASFQQKQPSQDGHPSEQDDDSTPPGCFLPRSKNAKESLEGLRQAMPSDPAPRPIRRPVGKDTTNLQGLSHRMSELSLCSNKNAREMTVGLGGARNSSHGSRSSGMSKKSGKWSWTGWFA